MFDYISQMLKAPTGFAQKFLKSPISVLFYGLISKWYLVSMSLIVVVMYWVIMGLYQTGIFQASATAFQKASLEIKGFAQHCIPKMGKIHEFLDCMQHTPEYKGNEITKPFEDIFDSQIARIKKDPLEPSDPLKSHSNYMISPYESIYKELQKMNNNLSGKEASKDDASAKSSKEDLNDFNLE